MFIASIENESRSARSDMFLRAQEHAAPDGAGVLFACLSINISLRMERNQDIVPRERNELVPPRA